MGCLLDLTIKKFHSVKAYNQPFENLLPLIKAAEIEMREHFLRNGKNSYYGQQVEHLTPEVISKAQQIFKNYYLGLNSNIKQSILGKNFWDFIIEGDPIFKLWGGPDGVEMGEDGIPEIVDYKYFEDNERGKSYLDMDLMPKIYTLLASPDLVRLGFKKARFKVRIWQDPKDESLSQEFDMNDISDLEKVFKEMILKILSTPNITFCEKSYCPACTSPKRDEWIHDCQSILNKFTHKSTLNTKEVFI